MLLFGVSKCSPVQLGFNIKDGSGFVLFSFDVKDRLVSFRLMFSELFGFGFQINKNRTSLTLIGWGGFRQDR